MILFVRLSRSISRTAQAVGGFSLSTWIWAVSFLTLIVALWTSTELVKLAVPASEILFYIGLVVGAGITLILVLNYFIARSK